MTKHAPVVWIVAAAVGWLFDFLFWKQVVGLNFPVFAAVCLVAGLLIMRLDQKGMSPRAAWLLPLIAFFGVVTIVRNEPFTRFLAVVFTLFLMALLAISFRGGRWLEYSLADYVLGVLKLAAGVLSRPLAFIAELRRQRHEGVTGHPRSEPWSVLRGILIALPILAVLTALLASADLIFGQDLALILKLMRLERLPEYGFRLAYMVIIGYAIVGVFLHAAAQSPQPSLLGEEKPTVPRFLGFTEAAIVLGSVLVLFASFVVIQFRYFFGGQANIQVAGYTYSEYARRGFGELVAVAFFSLLLILSLSTVTRREGRGQGRFFSWLSVAIVALVLVMLVSAYQRLVLYEMAFGFSRLRTYTHVVLAWMGLLLAAVAALEIMHRERAFAVAALIAGLGFAVNLSVLNVDGFIARQNVNRSVQGAKLDLPYLVSLSPDAVPTLAAIFIAPSYPLPTREAVGAVLACGLQVASGRPATDWRSFTWSSWEADQALRGIQVQLSEYERSGDTNAGDLLVAHWGNVYDCLNSAR